MPRQSRSSRPAARAPAPAAPSHQQSRSASTAAYPQQQPAAAAAAGRPTSLPAQAQPQQPGMFANIASTAAGVAGGSVIGHGISNMLFGGSGQAAAPPPPADLPAQSQAPANYQQAQGGACSIEARDFTKCLDATNDIQACSYYLEALKACQAAASKY